MKKLNALMKECGLPNAVLHVIGVGDDESGSFFHHVIHKLGNGNAGSVRGIDLVNVDHFCAGDHFLGIFSAFVMGLAVSPVIVGSNQQQAECKGLFRRKSNGG